MKFLFLLIILLSSLSSFAQDCVKIRSSINPDSSSYNIVLVPSGFGANTNLFELQARKLWAEASRLTPYGPSVQTLNVWIAKVATSETSYCKYESGRSIDCKERTAKSLAEVCPVAGKKYLVTMDNTSGYFGTADKIVSMTAFNQWSGQALAHELGHLLFKLSDEYEVSNYHDGKNCSSVKDQCEDWKDLIDAGQATCMPGCTGGQFLTGPDSIMRHLELKNFGPVNERLICCKYKAQTGIFPGYCQKYDQVGSGLENFCRSL